MEVSPIKLIVMLRDSIPGMGLKTAKEAIESTIGNYQSPVYAIINALQPTEGQVQDMLHTMFADEYRVADIKDMWDEFTSYITDNQQIPTIEAIENMVEILNDMKVEMQIAQSFDEELEVGLAC